MTTHASICNLRKLRSLGAITGRNGDWASRTANLPPAEFVNHIALANFRGVLIDRYGYADEGHGLQNELIVLLRASKVTMEDIFFSILKPIVTKCVRSMTALSWNPNDATYFIEWLDGFCPPEEHSDKEGF